MTLTKNTALIIGTLLLTLQGCAPSSYSIKAPALSTNAFETTTDETTLVISDARVLDKSAKFSAGTLGADLIFQGKVIDEIAYLTKFSIKELNARGIVIITQQR